MNHFEANYILQYPYDHLVAVVWHVVQHVEELRWENSRISEVVFHVWGIWHFSNLIRAVCVPDPFPDVVCRVYIQYPPPMFSLLRAPLCLLLAGSLDRESYSASGKRRLNMVWWGMWENSRVHLYIHQPACQPSSRPSRPLRAWTRGAFVPPSAGYTLPSPAPHLTLLSILLHLLCLPLFTGGPLPQNSTAGPLWK